MKGETLLRMARALSAQGLYEPGHPARERALGTALSSLTGFRAGSATFLVGRVILDGALEPAFRDWPWGRKLEAAGIQRIEVDGEVTEGGTRLSSRGA